MSALQSQQFGGGLGNVHIHGIQLLDGGQGHGLMRRHQGALGHVGLAGAAGDGRGETRVSRG